MIQILSLDATMAAEHGSSANISEDEMPRELPMFSSDGRGSCHLRIDEVCFVFHTPRQSPAVNRRKGKNGRPSFDRLMQRMTFSFHSGFAAA